MPKIGEITVPFTKPPTEWLCGRPVQKLGGTLTHSKLKTWWALRLEEWAEGRGYAGMSWDFRFAPPGEPLRPMCPDVAYLSFGRAAHLSDEELQAPPIAPDAAIEVLMRNERYIAYKRKLYLACGSLGDMVGELRFQ